LDIGGGPGRYALWLAGLGHHVALADLSPELLAMAREHVAEVDPRTRVCVEEILQADTVDLTHYPQVATSSFGSETGFWSARTIT
jgi:S-adenosylmethionine-dependent methyltransferase